jgi:hypothetical protein
MRHRQDRTTVRLSPAKFLDKDLIHSNLILSSLFIFCFEVLNFAIIEDVQGYLEEVFGFEEAQMEITSLEMLQHEMEHRKERVAARCRKRLKDLDSNRWKASCRLLNEIGVISERDLGDLEKIAKHRNEIAHELPQLLIDERLNVNLEHLVRMREILGNLDDWQMSMEKAVSPELADKELRSSRLIVVDHILSTALSSVLQDEEADVA